MAVVSRHATKALHRNWHEPLNISSWQVEFAYAQMQISKSNWQNQSVDISLDSSVILSSNDSNFFYRSTLLI